MLGAQAEVLDSRASGAGRVKVIYGNCASPSHETTEDLWKLLFALVPCAQSHSALCDRTVTQQGILFHVYVPGSSWNNVYVVTPVHLMSIGLLNAPSLSQKTFRYLIVEFSDSCACLQVAKNHICCPFSSLKTWSSEAAFLFFFFLFLGEGRGPYAGFLKPWTFLIFCFIYKAQVPRETS